MYFEDIIVSCYEGYRSGEAPRFFEWREHRYVVRRILDRWYEGGIKSTSDILDYYKVEVEDGSVYIIRYTRLFDRWAIKVPD